MKSVKFNPLTSLVMAVALAIGLVGCGGGSDNEVVEAADPEPMPMPMPPMPEAVSGEITLTEAQHDALLVVLPDNGNSVTLNVGADGVTREKVTFTCVSDYDCTVTVSNSAGTIVAMWESQTLGDGTASAMAAGLAADTVDTFAELNPGYTPSIRAEVVGDGVDSNAADPTFTSTELIGMGIGGPGVLNADMAGLRSDFQANGADLAGYATDADNNADTAAIAAPGASPDLRMGSTVTGAMDAIDPSDDMAPAPDGWVMKTLFRDWGDTAGDGDGGFETGAIVVKNLGVGTPYPFDRKLSGKYVNDAAKNMFALTIRADGTAPGVTTLSTSVDINNPGNADDNNDGVAATGTQWAAMVFDSDSLVGAQDQDLLVDDDETFTGMYFDAPGKFRCLAVAGMTGCKLSRNADGTVGVVDTDADMDGTQSSGRWSFTPDPDAMITVPDQDWMAYGAWLTTPDALAGDHRIGVFFNGMDPWVAADGSLDATNADGLRGTATYSGGATGVYVDGLASGLFTARAMLTADFDKASNGEDNEDVDYMISGRIDNFRGTDGVYLGDDTQASPNDPTAGENDWVVELGGLDIAGTGLIEATGTTGSADGVSWTGMWNGQLFGPSTDADDDAIAPSGVAGRFWAETADPDPIDATVGPVTAVVGAFGATKDD